MSKAIVVVDVPKSCCDCQYSGYLNVDNEHICVLVNKAIEHYNCIDIERADICPLKPIPEKKEILNIRDTDDMYDVFANKINVGYNRCIEDILGE